MKKSLLLASVAATIFLVGCSKVSVVDEEDSSSIATVNDTESSEGQQITFTAWFNSDKDNKTKTIREDDGKVFWCPGDKISIFKGSGSKTGGDIFTSSPNQEGSTDAKGNFSMADFKGTITSSASEGKYFGLYPYDATATCDGSTITTTLPSEQVAAEGTFANNLFISIGMSNSTEMAFHNLCGGIKFNLSQSGITEISIKGNDGEMLAGTVKIGFDEDNCPKVQSIVKGEKEIILKTSDGSAFKTGVDYYFICFPSAIAKGFNVTFRKNNTRAVFNYSNQDKHSIRRSVFGRLQNIDKNLSWESAIQFYDKNFKQVLLVATKVDTDKNGEISISEAAALEAMDLSQLSGVPPFYDCREMTYFTGVKSISIQDECMSTVDFSKCKELSNLTIGNCSNYSGLKLSSNTKLTSLKLKGYKHDFDFTTVPTLKNLYCENCKFTTMDLRNCDCANGSVLHLADNTITSLYLCHTWFSIEGNTIDSIELSTNDSVYHASIVKTTVKKIKISGDPLFEIIIKDCPSLSSISLTPLYSMFLALNSGLTITGNKSLKTLSLPAANTYYGRIDVSNNALTSLTFSDNVNYLHDCLIDCSKNQLSSLSIRPLKNCYVEGYFKLDCSPMNDSKGANLLKTLYVSASQGNIEGVTINRSTEYIPAETQIIGESGMIDDTIDEDF